MIRMKCPTCARAIGIDEAYVGKLALCPNCHGTFTVPVPAQLLDELAAPPVPSSVPLAPLPAGTQSPGESLLPDGPIPLAPEPGSPRPLFADTGDDAWSHSEPHRKPPGPEERASTATTPSSPAGAASGDWEIRDWKFLTLDDATAAPPAPAPAAGAPLPLLPDLPELSASPDLQPEAVEPLLLEPEPLAEALAPLTLEPVEPLVAEVIREPAAHLVAEPVFDDDGPVLLQEVVPITIVPPEAVTPSYGMLPPRLPPPLPTQPPPKSPSDPTWESDEDRFQRQARERDPSRPRKQRRSYGAVTLVPGLDDFYLGLLVLGAVWLTLAVLVIVAPRFCMVPIIVGGLVWVSATFWLNVCVQEADPYWKILFFTPIVTTPLSIIFQTRAVFVLGFVITQLWAAFFAVYFRDRALRAFLVTCLAMLISGMGWAAMPRGEPEPLDHQAPFVGGR